MVAELLNNIQRICGHMKEMCIRYFEQIMRPCVRAERTGDWHLHLYAVLQMLTYLHAAAYLAHAKSAHHYVQHMEELNSEVQHLFEFDKFWGGV